MIKSLLPLIDQHIADGYISKRKHPEAPYYIYNYTPKTQFENKWDEATTTCRGLILDEAGNIIARPFKKFHNWGSELAVVPNEPYDIFEKMDGSLGVLYWLNDLPHIATRGAFESDQAQRATEMLHTKYKDHWTWLNPEYTYLFEIIYPQNRIVVDYQGKEELVVLAAIHKETGREIPYDLLKETNRGFSIVEKHPPNDFNILAGLKDSNREGFVVRFQSGTRMKIKLAEYIQLHKVITTWTPRWIWECLVEGRSLSDEISKYPTIPDETYSKFRDVENKLKDDFKSLELKAKSLYEQVYSSLQDQTNRKEFALTVLGIPETRAFSDCLFKLWENKLIDQEIWKRLRPAGGELQIIDA